MEKLNGLEEGSFDEVIDQNSYDAYLEEQTQFDENNNIDTGRRALTGLLPAVLLDPKGTGDKLYNIYLALIANSESQDSPEALAIKAANVKFFKNLRITFTGNQVIERITTPEEASVYEKTLASAGAHLGNIKGRVDSTTQPNPFYFSVDKFALKAFPNPYALNAGSVTTTDTYTDGYVEDLFLSLAPTFTPKTILPMTLSNEAISMVTGIGSGDNIDGFKKNWQFLLSEAVSDLFAHLNVSNPKEGLTVEPEAVTMAKRLITTTWGMEIEPGPGIQILNALYSLGFADSITQVKLLKEYTAARIAKAILEGHGETESELRDGIVEALKELPGYTPRPIGPNVRSKIIDSDNITQKAIDSLRGQYILPADYDLNNPTHRLLLAGTQRYIFAEPFNGGVVDSKDGRKYVRITPFIVQIKKNSAGTDIDRELGIGNIARSGAITSIKVVGLDGKVKDIEGNLPLYDQDGGLISSIGIDLLSNNLGPGVEIQLTYTDGGSSYVLKATIGENFAEE